jgi:hypothetical protein
MKHSVETNFTMIVLYTSFLTRNELVPSLTENMASGLLSFCGGDANDSWLKCWYNKVIPNWGAAAQKGAAKRCQGYRRILNYCLFIDVSLQKVPPNFLIDQKGAASRKRLKSTGKIE